MLILMFKLISYFEGTEFLWLTRVFCKVKIRILHSFQWSTDPPLSTGEEKERRTRKGKAMNVKRKNGACSRKPYLLCESVSFKYCLRVFAWVHVALVTQHEKPMCCITLSSVTFPVPPYSSALSHKRHDFRKKLLNIKCVFLFFLQLLSKIFLILRTI